MASAKLFNLVAISTLAIFAASFGVEPVTAVSSGSGHTARGHGSIAKRKRSGTVARRCKPKAPTPAPGTTDPAPVPQPSQAPKPETPKPETPKPETSKPEEPKPSPPTGGNGAAKRGLAWDLGNDPSLKYWKTDKTSFLYTWSAYYHKDAKKLGFTPLPMFWGAKQENDFVKMVVNGPDDYADYILGFNEPDHGEQSSMSPGQGVELWKRLIQPMKSRNYKLISPATTSGGAGDTWMSEFMDQCKGCTFDGMGLHYYGTDPKQMIKYIEDRHNKYGLPIWITEFACQDFGPANKQCSDAQVKNFLQTILEYADNTPWIHAVIPFGVLHNMNNVAYTNQLMASSGEPNSLGKLFVGL